MKMTVSFQNQDARSSAADFSICPFHLSPNQLQYKAVFLTMSCFIRQTVSQDQEIYFLFKYQLYLRLMMILADLQPRQAFWD